MTGKLAYVLDQSDNMFGKKKRVEKFYDEKYDKNKEYYNLTNKIKIIKQYIKNGQGHSQSFQEGLYEKRRIKNI